MKKSLSLLLLAASAATLAACGNSEDNASANESTTNTNNAAEEQPANNENNAANNGAEETNETNETNTADEAGAREITHAMGTTTIEGTPERVVTLYQGASDTILEFDVTPVGAVESWAEMPMYEYISEEYADATFVGDETQPNLEEIAALEPDLIVATHIRHEEIYDQLAEIAPTVVSDMIYDFKETTTLLGEALGQEDQADALLADWDERVADFQSKTDEIENWPMSAAVLNYREDHARIYVTGYAGSILQELGFEEPRDLEGEDHEIVMLQDMESIPQMNADIIFEFMEDTPTVAETHTNWTSHPLYQNLDAVQNDNVYQVNDITWNLSGGLKSAHLMLDDLYEYMGLEK
ncbi:iron-siderophore ABC transporter substrate-binding protein [Paenalkalicoccus suaedae]|uniref:Iron-siderophore ABC transporter substrate-binding protein n=1 Tax=Paenalkalicoccus suaedae TaxID=2592382 RepID=A0A859FJN3_9BACI|nr:iron-siderophore ABC transporter substrate-binding protein [Paenalkalicoccus suaedae]QKS72996.1 iron-siderophore ABC transporter substrate-binding protein [Paenalkalicoccus suaedae]